MVAEGIPGQVGEDPVVLVTVVAVMGENEVGLEGRPDRFKPLVNRVPLARKITFPKEATRIRFRETPSKNSSALANASPSRGPGAENTTQ